MMIETHRRCHVIAAWARCRNATLLVDHDGQPTRKAHGGWRRGSKPMMQMLETWRWRSLPTLNKVKFLSSPTRFPWLRVMWARLSKAEQREFRKLARQDLKREWGRFDHAQVIPDLGAGDCNRVGHHPRHELEKNPRHELEKIEPER